MYSVLEHICQGALLVIVPALLVAKFFWQQRIAWWLVVLVTAVASTTLGIALDHLGSPAHFERYDACIQAAVDISAQMDCGYFTYDVFVTPVYLKWAWGLLLLAVLLPFYGLAEWLRSRRRRLSAA